jgi:hypothetical protein
MRTATIVTISIRGNNMKNIFPSLIALALKVDV